MENAKSKKCPFLDEMPIGDIDTKSPQGLIAAQIIELITTCGCLENRSVFLNGAWGSGKTSIIKYLKEKEKKEENKIGVLKIDAWDAPKTLITWDILKRIADKVLGIEHQSERLENKKFQKWFAGSHKRELKYAKSTALFYFILFAFAPFVAFFINLYSEKAKDSDSLVMFWTQPSTIIGSISVFIIATLIFTACHKFSEILLPFFSGSASQYSEYSEGEDCPPSKADEIAYCILEDYKESHLAVFIDNLDRLESSAQRNYLDALFIVMDAFFKEENCQQCKVWFIIVADESKMLASANAVPPPSSPEPDNPPPSGPSIWQNYADKIAPLHFFLPNPTQETLGLIFRSLWRENRDLNSREPSILDYTLSLGTYATYRDVKKTLNSIFSLYSMLKKIIIKDLDEDMLLLAVCFVSIKSRELNFTFNKVAISRPLSNLPGFVNDEDLLIEYIYSAYYLVPLLSQAYVFKLIEDALKNKTALPPLFTLAKSFPEQVRDFFMDYLKTPADKCSFYLNIVYPINNEEGQAVIINFPPEAADSILEAFFKAPKKMKGQGKALAQLYCLMSSKNQNIDSGLNTSIGLWTPAEEQTAFITDFTQKYSSPMDASKLFKPILSTKFLTPAFLSSIYGRLDVFTKPFRIQRLGTISPEALSNFVTLLQGDIKNLPHFNLFDVLNPDIPKPRIAHFASIMELLFNVYRYTTNNENYHLFTEALPSYEEMMKKTEFVLFSHALILCRLHKEIVEGGGNPYVEDISRLSDRLLGGEKDMYTALILFCLSKEYNDAGLLPLKIEMLKKIMEMEHRNQDDFIKVHKEFYDLFEQENDTTKEIITKYGILKDKLGG